MAITQGDASDGVRTGLAGRIATQLQADYGVHFPKGSKEAAGINSLAGGIVSSLNLDKVDSLTQVSGGGGGGGGSSGPVAGKPTSPDPRDDEFEGGAYTGWTAKGTQLATAIDPYAGFSTPANSYRHSWNSVRSSWWMLQPTADQSQCGIQKPIALADGDLVYCRFSVAVRSGVPIGNNNQDGHVEIVLSDDTNFTNIAFMALNRYFGGNGGQGWVCSGAISGGTLTETYHDFSTSNNRSVPLIEYFLIQRKGTTYHHWVGTSDGHWFWLAQKGVSATMNYVYIGSRAGYTTSPGNTISGFDFIRFRTNGTLP